MPTLSKLFTVFVGENALRKANIKFDPRPRKIIEQKQTIAQKLRNFRCFHGLKGEKFRGIPSITCLLESCFWGHPVLFQDLKFPHNLSFLLYTVFANKFQIKLLVVFSHFWDTLYVDWLNFFFFCRGPGHDYDGEYPF